jgi:hypothetical protein
MPLVFPTTFCVNIEPPGLWVDTHDALPLSMMGSPLLHPCVRGWPARRTSISLKSLSLLGWRLCGGPHFGFHFMWGSEQGVSSFQGARRDTKSLTHYLRSGRGRILSEQGQFESAVCLVRTFGYPGCPHNALAGIHDTSLPPWGSSLSPLSCVG